MIVMAGVNNSQRNSGNRLRRIARILGSLIAVYWLVFGVGSVIVESNPWTWESTMMSVFVIGTTTSIALAWRRERLGGILAIIFGTAESIFAYIVAGQYRLLAVLVSGVPLIIVGVLFLFSHRVTNRP